MHLERADDHPPGEQPHHQNLRWLEDETDELENLHNAHDPGSTSETRPLGPETDLFESFQMTSDSCLRRHRITNGDAEHPAGCGKRSAPIKRGILEKTPSDRTSKCVVMPIVMIVFSGHDRS